MGHGHSKPKAPDMADSHGNIFIVNSRGDWDSKLAEANAAGKVIVVDFTATWCGPCQMIAPFFAELSVKYPQLIYLKVDVDALSDISQQMEVRAMPTFLFLKDGKQADILVGANKSALENAVKIFAEQSVLAA